MLVDLDEILVSLKEGRHIPEETVYALCMDSQELLMNESNVARVDTPVTICGDIHGQLHDLLTLF